jgi:hypothetical protein
MTMIIPIRLPGVDLALKACDLTTFRFQHPSTHWVVDVDVIQVTRSEWAVMPESMDPNWLVSFLADDRVLAARYRG